MQKGSLCQDGLCANGPLCKRVSVESSRCVKASVSMFCVKGCLCKRSVCKSCSVFERLCV